MAHHRAAAASVVVPAHNEERSIGRLLSALAPSALDGSLEVVVVCNGCSDATSQHAAAFSGVQVVEIPEASKHLAMRAGSAEATVFPRLYVDADVQIDAGSILRLAEVVRNGSVHACAPGRRYVLEGVSVLARWYYDVWQQLPQVRTGLFGRGVIALSEEGHRRYERLPGAMSDDLVISELFAPGERVVDEAATVVVWPARTVRALLRRRVRVRTGNAQADAAGLRTDQAHTRPAVLMRILREQPRLAIKMPVFVGVALLASWRARQATKRGDFTTWIRDESSRT